jgi:excisionase family DNA binding protein
MTPADRLEPEYMTAEEVCRLLRISRPTLYSALARGQVPGALRVGRCWRFRRAALVANSGGVQACVSRHGVQP